MYNNLNIANIGFCISEKSGVYIANNFVIGFRYHDVNDENIITMYTINHSFTIYTHTRKYLDFNSVSKKIITRLSG